jgi:hypothetical protein
MSSRTRSTLALILAGLLSGCATSFDIDAHEDTAWLVRETPHFVFHYRAASPAERDIDKILANAESDRAVILGKLEVSCGAVINYYLYNTEEGATAIGISYGGYAVSTFMTVRETYGDWRHGSAGKHEMTHLIASCALGESHYPVLTEGLAIAIDGGYGGSFPVVMRKFWLRQGVLTISRMVDAPFADGPDAFYPQSGSFVRYLMDRYGVASFKQFYPAADFQEGLQRVYGLTLPELETEYREYLALMIGSTDGSLRLAMPPDGRVRLARKSAPVLD